MDLTATRLRSFGLVSVILIGSCGVPGARSDRTDCALARIGRFEDVGTQDTRYVLTRTWNEQVEELPAIGLVSRSRVIWLDSCTYMLFGRTVLTGDQGPISSLDTLKVSIVDAGPEGFEYEAVILSVDSKLNGRRIRGRQVLLK